METAENVGAVPAAEAEKGTVSKETLKVMGFTKRAAQRIWANGGSGKYLNTRITCKVLLVHHSNSFEHVVAMQKRAATMARDESVDARTRVAAMSIVPQCAMALARLSEVAIAAARNLDEPEEEGGKSPVKAMQNNFFGFPPVSDGSERRKKSTAISGEATASDVQV